MRNGRMRRTWLLIIPSTLLITCLLLAAILAISNRGLATATATADELNATEQAQLSEALHLRQTMGARAWPGWPEVDIPVLVYNEQYAFLVNYPGAPPDGWRTVPDDEQVGGAWEPVPADGVPGGSYYRLRLPGPDVTPQAFTVRVGDAWVGSLPTHTWFRLGLVKQIRQDLPSFLRPFFPYRLAADLFVGGSEKYISSLMHESFHAYQGAVAQGRLAAAEEATQREAQYPAGDQAFQAAWQAELDLLANAAERALDDAPREELEAMAVDFLALRGERREAAGLTPDLAAYEQQREWLEGQAKYVELEMWRQGMVATDYEPHAAVANLDDYDGYQGADTAWSREIDQIRRMAGDSGDGRFYYSGMGQAVLLDRLMPAWKSLSFNEGVTLEGLLAVAVAE